MFVRGQKRYQMGNHQGSVVALVSDKHIAESMPDTDNDGYDEVDYYEADIHALQDYYPYGMVMPGRSARLYATGAFFPELMRDADATGLTPFAATNWRFGFQGMEQDAEVKGFGNHYTTQFRQYDPRLGRWFSPDPIHHPWQSPYSAMDCNPVGYTDPYGLSTGPGDRPDEHIPMGDESEYDENNPDHNPNAKKSQQDGGTLKRNLIVYSNGGRIIERYSSQSKQAIFIDNNPNRWEDYTLTRRSVYAFQLEKDIEEAKKIAYITAFPISMSKEEMNQSSKGKIYLLETAEGFLPKIKNIGDGKKTIGFGTVLTTSEEVEKYKNGITREEALAIATVDIPVYVAELKSKLNDDVWLTQAQFDILTSLYYNLGGPNSEDLIEVVNKNMAIDNLSAGNVESARENVASEIRKYVYSNGVKWDGLVKRRNAEANAFINSGLPIKVY